MPSFFASNLLLDDTLMVNQFKSLLSGEYLGSYVSQTLIKGIMFPFTLYIIKALKLSFSIGLTLIYIFSCIYFLKAISNLIKNKIALLIIFIFLLFNPLTYSSELFQRLYSNTISIPELLFFLGAIINIICSKKDKYIHYAVLGFVTAAMYLTRDDNIWALVILIILLVYKLYKNHTLKSICINLVPVLILIICLNYVSLFNHKYYNIYAYSELDQTSFKDAYVKVLQIKDDKKINRVAIPKTTYYKLCEKSKVMNCTKYDVDVLYYKYLLGDDELNNSKAMWVFRYFAYDRLHFSDGKEANEYFEKLAKEIDELFEKGEFEKELVLPSVFMYMPTKNGVKEFPMNMLAALWYTSSYKNVKTFSENDILKIEDVSYDNLVDAYTFSCTNSRSLETIIDNNGLLYEIIRVIYKYFTLIFGIIAFIVYIINIKKLDKMNLILHMLMLTYLMIMFGVVYTHTFAFHAIRYRYLCNVYILQNLFILLNLVRLYENKKGNILRDEVQ